MNTPKEVGKTTGLGPPSSAVYLYAWCKPHYWSANPTQGMHARTQAYAFVYTLYTYTTDVQAYLIKYIKGWHFQ